VSRPSTTPAPIAFDSFKAVRSRRDGWLSDASKKMAVAH